MLFLILDSWCTLSYFQRQPSVGSTQTPTSRSRPASTRRSTTRYYPRWTPGTTRRTTRLITTTTTTTSTTTTTTTTSTSEPTTTYGGIVEIPYDDIDDNMPQSRDDCFDFYW